MKKIGIVLMMALLPSWAFAAEKAKNVPGGYEKYGETQTVEGCFQMPDAETRSNCLTELAVLERMVADCDIIELPGMVTDCIDQVAMATEIRKEDCTDLSDNGRVYCLQKVKT